MAAPTRTVGPTLVSSGATAQSEYSFPNALNCTSGRSAFVGVTVCVDGGTNTLLGATLGGTTMVAVGTQRRANLTNTWIFKLENHALSGQKTLVVTVDGANGYGAAATSVEFSGSSAPVVDKEAGVEGTGETQSVTLTGVAANAAIFSVMARQFSNTETAGSGYTLMDLANAVDYCMGEYDDDAGAAGNKVVDYTGGDLLFAISAISITVAASGAAPPVLFGGATGAGGFSDLTGGFRASSSGLLVPHRRIYLPPRVRHELRAP